MLIDGFERRIFDVIWVATCFLPGKTGESEHASGLVSGGRIGGAAIEAHVTKMLTGWVGLFPQGWSAEDYMNSV